MDGGDRTTDEEANQAGGRPSGDSGGLSRDVIFDVLRSERRRAVLRHLDTTDGAASVAELGAAVSACERGVEVSAARRRRVDVSLHQVHLPKLAEAGVVDYDREAKTARLREGCELLFEYLYFESDP